MSVLLFLTGLWATLMLAGAAIFLRARVHNRAQDYRRAADLAWIAFFVFLGAVVVAVVRIAVKIEEIG